MPRRPAPRGVPYTDYLVDTYSDLVLRVCFSRLGSLHDAKDACQTVFLKYLARTAEDPTPFVDAEHEKAWFIRCAINTCADFRRNGWNRKVAPLEEAAQTPAPSPSPDSSLERKERHRQVFQALQELSPAQRQAVYLRYYEQYPVKAIADLTGEAPNTVSQHLTRARTKLRGLLEEEAP